MDDSLFDELILYISSKTKWSYLQAHIHIIFVQLTLSELIHVHLDCQNNRCGKLRFFRHWIPTNSVKELKGT